jgi:hypothetical protein
MSNVRESFEELNYVYIFSKPSENLSFWTDRCKGIWIHAISLFNYPRLCGRHLKSSQIQVKLGITCMQISYQGDDPS